MTLKQIIIVDEDGSKFVLKTSEEPYEIEEVIDGKHRVEWGLDKPLTAVLMRIAQEEWRKLREAGARLVTRWRT